MYLTLFKKIKFPFLLLLFSEILLLLLFPVHQIFSPTLTAGGDTPSHIISALAMDTGPFALFSPVTWVHGSFAGFPLFLNYFPLPFALMALISKAVSLLVAFKLVTLLGIIPLPPAVYYSLHRLGYCRKTSAIGAVLSLSFLFMTENSIWGGNIPSNLSGEFAFSISLTLYVVFAGKLYADIAGGRKNLTVNSALEALIALSHGYPLIQSVLGSSYFVFRGKTIGYLFRLHLGAAGFAAFWLLPLLWRLPWNTVYSYSWHFESWREVAPPILWPSFAGTLILAFSTVRRIFQGNTESISYFKEPASNPDLYLFWNLTVALLGFSLAPSLGLVDIRFLPMAQITIVLLGAAGWGRLISGLPRPNLWLAGLSAGVIALALTKVALLDALIQWNYSGMESKPLWNSFLQVNDYLSGDQNSPRVASEYNQITNDAGSVRTFELLPIYSGRSTLEGLYMQSGLSSPFIYYTQSEISQVPSNPFPQFYYSRPNPGRAAAHLRLFNTSQVVAVSDNISNAMDFSPDYELNIVFPPYRIYRIKDCAGSYVEPMRFKPLRIAYHDWKKVQFDWFRKSSLKVPLIVAQEDTAGDYWKSLENYAGDPENISETPVSPENENLQASAVLSDGSITIDTARPGRPLWIKISYHPDWRITEGEGELYLASPAFMMLVPKTSRVVLTFDTHTGVYFWGKLLSLFTLFAFALPPFLSRIKGFRGISRFWKRIFERSRHLRGLSLKLEKNTGLFAAFALMTVVIVAAVATRDQRDPVLLYNVALSSFEKTYGGTYSPEENVSQNAHPLPAAPETPRLFNLFNEGVQKFGHSSVTDFSILYETYLMSALGKWENLEAMLKNFLRENPDNRIESECFEWMGIAALKLGRTHDAEDCFRKALAVWPANNASKRAGLCLAEIAGTETLLDEAGSFFDSGGYPGAYAIYNSLCGSKDRQTAARSTIDLAYSSFFMNRWEQASDLFLQWLGDNMDTPESDHARSDFKQCRTIMDQNRRWIGQTDPKTPGPIVRFLNWAGMEISSTFVTPGKKK